VTAAEFVAPGRLACPARAVASSDGGATSSPSRCRWSSKLCGSVTVPDDVRLWLTLNVGDGPVVGSVGSLAAGEVAFGGWLGLLAAVRTLLPREFAHGGQHQDVHRGSQVRVQDNVTHVHAVVGGATRPQHLPRGRAEAPGPCSIHDEIEALAPAASGDLAGAIEALEGILRAGEPHDEPFERARILLALGRVRRRAKQRAQAREALAEALEIFEQIGAPGWAETAQAEMARCGIRVAEGELTASEQRVAELVAEGMSNREIAGAAFISPKTVEANLARIYRKLGFRSRAQVGVYVAMRAQGEPRA
jgi:DNA-binding CsgD family transcriptional regulator